MALQIVIFFRFLGVVLFWIFSGPLRQNLYVMTIRIQATGTVDRYDTGTYVLSVFMPDEYLYHSHTTKYSTSGPYHIQ